MSSTTIRSASRGSLRRGSCATICARSTPIGRFDVLFPWGPFNLQFALKYRSELFPDTPIVYYSATLDEVRDYSLPPMTGVLNLDTYERTVDLVLRMHPDTKEVFVISGTPQRDRSIEHDVAVQLAGFKDRVKLTYLTDLPLD